ncbi:hypothetical protein ES707_21292 [subsurface metagenome]
MERYRINPELECVNLTKEQKERLERLKPVDLEDLLKNAAENNIELTYRGIDANGIPHIKVRKRQ